MAFQEIEPVPAKLKFTCDSCIKTELIHGKLRKDTYEPDNFPNTWIKITVPDRDSYSSYYYICSECWVVIEKGFRKNA